MIALALALQLAFAEPELDPTQREAAAEFDRGAVAYAAGDFAGALAAFEHAQALAPHDRVRANIAMCLAELGRLDEAIGQLEAALAGTELDEAERTIVRAQIEKLRARIPPPPEPEPAPVVEPVPPPRVELPPDDPPPKRVRTKPSALLWTGLPLTAVGAAGTIVFGLRTQSQHDAYVAMPESDTRKQGLRARALTNASIAVLSLGAALIVADVIRIAVKRRRVATVATRR
ncbi:MAG TPA: tetratricopeptide repeat protein [Nannocystaceae bacterium]|nr:tetratricopeptide repeat protein [Nannocystaceae bacterium]